MLSDDEIYSNYLPINFSEEKNKKEDSYNETFHKNELLLSEIKQIIVQTFIEHNIVDSVPQSHSDNLKYTLSSKKLEMLKKCCGNDSENYTEDL
jgi:hypothetical protein